MTRPQIRDAPVRNDKVCIVGMMTNTDDVEFSLLISILLNIRSLYK